MTRLECRNCRVDDSLNKVLVVIVGNLLRGKTSKVKNEYARTQQVSDKLASEEINS